MSNTIKFIINCGDINFVAEAPRDMTVEQLVEQASRIKPDRSVCGICKAEENDGVEIIFDYDDVVKVGADISCTIKDEDCSDHRTYWTDYV